MANTEPSGTKARVNLGEHMRDHISIIDDPSRWKACQFRGCGSRTSSFLIPDAHKWDGEDKR